ncbi:alginate export family protein [Novosphingobium sp. ST904]|uniref:alginate export family protein n=1 Tax=Novosphingobium sp. ST904 TaxID=1684385 RepID=UPI0009E938E6|nr:alginate export family protein [Novosphingobium sp. ST904]TCM39210.1 alginate export protein [Novosphingobium sp. ST904]
MIFGFPDPVRKGRVSFLLSGAGRTALAVVGGGVLLAGNAGAALAQGWLETALGAPEGLTVKGEVRARVEGIDGQFRPNAAQDDALLALKTTLQVEYDGGPWRVGGELWDARAYGEKSNSSAGTNEVDAMELVQAYVGLDFDMAGGTKGQLTAGRFTMNVGSRRLVARQAFRNTTNAFTGANFQWKGHGGDQFTAFWAMPQLRLPDDREGIHDNSVKWDKETTGLQFYGASFTKGGVLGGTLEVYAYGLDERDGADRPTRNRHLYTPGLRAWRKPTAGKFDYDLEGAYQFGSTRLTTSGADVTDLDVSAYLIHAEFGRTFGGGWQPRLSADFDLGSGDKAGSKSYNRFDTLFGARRFDFGPTSLYGAIGRFNLMSGGVRGEVKPDKVSDIMVMYRALWLDSKTDSFSSTGVRDAAGESGRFGGHQIEARYRRTLIPDVLRVDTGVAYLAKGRFLKEAPNAPQSGDTKYGYVDLYFDF